MMMTAGATVDDSRVNHLSLVSLTYGSSQVSGDAVHASRAPSRRTTVQARGLHVTRGGPSDDLLFLVC